MTSDIAKSFISKYEYHRVAGYVAHCLRTQMPLAWGEVRDWEQDISLFIMLHKGDILVADNALDFIFRATRNKIIDVYRARECETRALAGLQIALEAMPTYSRYRDESVADSVIRTALHELKIIWPVDTTVNKLLIDYVTGGENHTRDRILEVISRASFHRRKNLVTKLMKTELNNALEQEPCA